MRALYTLLILILVSLQSNSATWEKLFSARSTDVFRSVREVPAGGYICAGYTADSTVNDSDAYAVRLNTMGDTIWTYKYNSGPNKKDLFYKVLPTSDGGFVFCGYSTGIANSDDVLIQKINSSGVLQWTRTWGGNLRDRGQDIIQTSDGNYTVVGYTTSPPATYYDAFMFRLSSSGDSLWSKRYGGGPGSYDDANGVKQLADNGYIIGGQSSNGTNGLDQYLVRTDSSGNTIWSKRFGSIYTDNIDYVALTPDGFILAGSTYDTLHGDDGYLVRTDTAGNVQWAFAYGDSLPDDFHRVEMTTSGDFIASGTTSSIGALEPNMWLAKISSSGSLIWQRAFGGDNHDHGYSAEETSDGGYIIAGHTGSYGYNYEEAYVVKTDDNGIVSNKLVYTSIFSLVSPTPATCGSANTPVMLKMRNFSNASIPNIPCTVQVTGSANQTFTQTFSASADTVTIGNLNTAAGGTYTFTCFTNNDNDVCPKRNIITVTVTIPPFQAPPTLTGDQRCGNGTTTLTASSSGTVYWFNVPNGGVSIASGPSYTTPPLTSTTTYYAQTELNCPSTRLPVTATVNPMPANPVSSGGYHCGPGVVTINVTSNDNVSWYTTASGGSPFTTGLSYTTPLLNSTTTYYIEASNANCTTARFPVVATISSLAADPVTTNGSRCGTGAVILNATSSDPVEWYDAPSGGNLVGNSNILITPVISTTTTFYAQANNGCVSNRVAAIATINPLAADPVVAGDVERCGPGTLTLTASASGTLNWYNVTVGGNQLGSGSNFTTPFISSSTTYYVEAFNGTCPSNRIPVNAIINPLPLIYLGNDTNIVSGTFYIDAGPGFNSYLWSENSTTQGITVNSTGTYCVTVTDANSCSGTDCIQVDFSIGVPENQFSGVSVYPNPTTGIIRIELPAGEKVRLIVSDLSGQVVYNSTVTGNDNFIDLSSFAKGVYSLTMKNEKGVGNRRIVLQ